MKTPDYDFLPGRLSKDPLLRFVQQMSTDALYKGVGLILLGCVASSFALWVKRRGDPPSLGWYLFLGIALFILGYGIFLVMVQPPWWHVPHL